MVRPTTGKYIYHESITNYIKAVWPYLCIPHAGSARGLAAEDFSLWKGFLSSKSDGADSPPDLSCFLPFIPSRKDESLAESVPTAQQLHNQHSLIMQQLYTGT